MFLVIITAQRQVWNSFLYFSNMTVPLQFFVCIFLEVFFKRNLFSSFHWTACQVHLNFEMESWKFILQVCAPLFAVWISNSAFRKVQNINRQQHKLTEDYTNLQFRLNKKSVLAFLAFFRLLVFLHLPSLLGNWSIEVSE